MKFAMCNEFCEGYSIEQVADLAKEVGYDGVEFAPYTLGKTVFDISHEQRKSIRDTIESRGLEVVGLHWLLAKTEGLHINHPDEVIRKRTQTYYQELIRCCSEMGGTRMIHGSPQQRAIVDGESYEATFDRTVEFFKQGALVAAQHGVILCVEPLARDDANFINTAEEAVKIIDAVGHPSVQLILDCKAMIDEDKSIPQLVEENADHLKHFHANDDTRSYPGTGSIDFKAALAALKKINYSDWVSIEVFDFNPPPQQIASEGLTHLKASL